MHGRRPTILLVDDDDLVRASLRAGLWEAGYRVVSSAEPRRALERFVTEPEMFDCAVLDVVMPMLDGLALAGHLRRTRAELPIVLMSGFQSDAPAEVRGTTPTRFVAKPFRIRELLDVIVELLGPSDRSR